MSKFWLKINYVTKQCISIAVSTLEIILKKKLILSCILYRNFHSDGTLARLLSIFTWFRTNPRLYMIYIWLRRHVYFRMAVVGIPCSIRNILRISFRFLIFSSQTASSVRARCVLFVSINSADGNCILQLLGTVISSATACSRIIWRALPYCAQNLEDFQSLLLTQFLRRNEFLWNHVLVKKIDDDVPSFVRRRRCITYSIIRNNYTILWRT